MKEDESIKVEALLSSVSKRDSTHYLFNGTEYKGKNALIRAILCYLLITKQLDFSKINDRWKEYLEKRVGRINDFPSSQQWTVNKHYDSSDEDTQNKLNKVLEKELKSLKNKKVVLLYDERGFENAQRMIKEGKRKKDLSHDYSFYDFGNQKLYYFNQWGWGNIDYFIGFYRTIEGSSKNGSDPTIELTWATTD